MIESPLSTATQGSGSRKDQGWCVPKPIQSFGGKLMTQQVWCWGRDVECDEGMSIPTITPKLNPSPATNGDCKKTVDVDEESNLDLVLQDVGFDSDYEINQSLKCVLPLVRKDRNWTHDDPEDDKDALGPEGLYLTGHYTVTNPEMLSML